MSFDRDHYASLFRNLLEVSDASPLDSRESRSAARLLSHALLNFARSHDGPDSISAVEDVLPWFRAAVEIENREEATTAGGMADALEEAGLVDELDRGDLERLVKTAEGTESGDEAAGSTEAVAATVRECWPDVAAADRAVAELPSDEDRLADALVLYTESARRALRAAGTAANSGPGEAARSKFPVLRDDERRRRGIAALDVFGALESGRGEGLRTDGESPGRDVERFETSLAERLGEHGVAPAVRAALALGEVRGDQRRGASGTATATSHRELLGNIPWMRRHLWWADLAEALMEMRGRCASRLDGETSERALGPWLEYLEGPNRRLAEATELSESEALNWAHYSLHAVDVCDRVAERGGLTTADRRQLTEIEETLRARALAARGDNDGRAETTEEANPDDRAEAEVEEPAVAHATTKG